MTAPAFFGFFPNIRPSRFGGVEASGRLAWQALFELARTRGETTKLLCYEWDDSPGKTDAPLRARNQVLLGPLDPPAEGFERSVARTKTRAIWMSLRANVKPRIVLVWHLGLLKLVPFLHAPNARVVVFLHGIEAWRSQDRWTRYILPRVHLFLSNSAFTYQRFMQFQPQLRNIAHHVVPLGIAAVQSSPCAPTDPPAVLMLSRLDRSEDYKGHREVLGVWARVRARVPGAQLWIAGDGNLRSELELLARVQDPEQSIRFLGRVSETQKQELLDACRAFVMPSRGEGFGLVYLEAMRAGRPCLVSDCDAGREVVNPPEAGLAANPADAGALENAIVSLLSDQQAWDTWSQQARARYQAHFTAAQFQTRIVANFLPLL